MTFRLRIVCFLLIALAFASAKGWHVSTKTPSSSPSYVLALATANRFLHAWQAGDLETGIVLLSDNARHAQTSESLEALFSAAANRAFEINHGKCERGRYRFPVVMFSGVDHGVHRKFSEIVLVKTGKDEWAVDKLP